MTLGPELQSKILRLHFVERWGAHTIARQLQIHHSAVERILSQAGVPQAERTQSRSIRDPYTPFILETLEQYPRLSATRLYVMACERGYSGCSSHFRARVAELRPRKQPEAFQRLKSFPGEQMQCDWGSFGHLNIGRAKRPLMAFVMVLSWSRMIFVRFYLNARMESFLRGHVAAFSHFQGVARVVLYDNLKSAVLQRHGDAITFNPELLNLSAHYRFEPRPVAPYRAMRRGGLKEEYGIYAIASLPPELSLIWMILMHKRCAGAWNIARNVPVPKTHQSPLAMPLSKRNPNSLRYRIIRTLPMIVSVCRSAKHLTPDTI